jgi:nitroreductase
MEFVDVVRRRRMIRRYDPARPVDRVTIEHLLELAIRSPSAGFSQGWHFLVLDAVEARQLFWSATAADGPSDSWLDGMRTAPVLIVALSDKKVYLDRYAEPDKGWADRDEARWPVPYWHIDTGMASLLILLGAVDEGIGACFFGVPADRVDALRAAFAVPDRLVPVGVISLGHPVPDQRSPSLRRGRAPVSQVSSYNSFTEPPAG